MEAGCVAGGGELVAKSALAEHFGKLRQKLQVFLGRVFGHQQYEYLPNRFAIWRIKRNRLTRPHERAQRVGESTDPTVWDRDTLAEPCRTEFLACKQAVEYDGSRNLCLVLEQLTDLLEEPFLARRFEVEQDVRFGKQLRDLVQVGSGPAEQSGGRSRSDAARRQMAHDYTLLRRLPAARDGCGYPLNRRHIVAVTVALLFVLEHLAVKLVGKCVDRRVHVRLDAFGMDLLATYMQVGCDLLPELVDREHDVDVDDVVEMAGQSHQFDGYVGADRWRNI